MHEQYQIKISILSKYTLLVTSILKIRSTYLNIQQVKGNLFHLLAHCVFSAISNSSDTLAICQHSESINKQLLKFFVPTYLKYFILYLSIYVHNSKLPLLMIFLVFKTESYYILQHKN